MKTLIVLLTVATLSFAQDAVRHIPPPPRVFVPPAGYDLAPQVAFLIAHDRFKRAVYMKGQTQGLSEFLDDDGLILKPYPMTAKEFRSALPKPGGNDVTVLQVGYTHGADSGDMGVTSDRFEVFDKATQESIGTGYWLTIWRKTGQDWKIALSCTWRVPPAMPPRMTERLVGFHPSKGRTFPVSTQELIALENEFSKTSVEQGLGSAYQKFGSTNVMMQRTAAHAVFGPKAIGSSPVGKLLAKWTPDQVGEASAGDFAYVYGKEVDSNQQEGTYVRIWKRSSDGDWKIVMDVTMPLANDSRQETVP
jgi:hypothetical protein